MYTRVLRKLEASKMAQQTHRNCDARNCQNPAEILMTKPDGSYDGAVRQFCPDHVATAQSYGWKVV